MGCMLQAQQNTQDVQMQIRGYQKCEICES